MANENLPIIAFKDEILDVLQENSAVIITAETGAGKSTQVPQFLLDDGYDIVVTEPRRLAVRTIAERVAHEMGGDLGGEVVGYRTAYGRCDNVEHTRCLFATDGLQLIRELMNAGEHNVLVIDEVHEWNTNIDTLVAWARMMDEEYTSDFKVVLMSATLESEKLSAFFNNAPVIKVPGRVFPIETRETGETLIEDVELLASAGRNVLVFQPGKQEIQDTCDLLKKRMQVEVEILPLHGQLTPEEQAKCFQHFNCPKIVVSTNVAQTSVTIDDIDAVVDSGLERRIEITDGVEGLYLRPISRADAKQRKGRAGRTKKGIYIDWCPTSKRLDFPIAEIERSRLDQTVLRLAMAGFDMEELKFFHQPKKSDIHNARQSLIRLNCMNADGSVTKIGKLVNRLPVSVQHARMLVEADRLGVMDDVLTVAAIMEMSGITVPPPSRNRPNRPDWRYMVPNENESDVMAQLHVWELARTMTKDEMRTKGIALKKYFRAREVRNHLSKTVKRFFRFGSTGSRENILKAVCAGMVDHLYKGSYMTYQNGEGVERELGSASCVRGAKWLIGKPFDLQIETMRGMITLNLIELANKIDPMWLAEIAPQLAEKKKGLNPRFDSEKDTVVSTTQVFFNEQMVEEKEVADVEHPEASLIFAKWLSSCAKLPSSDTESTIYRDLTVVLHSNTKRQEQAQRLNIRSGEETFKVYSQEEMFEQFSTALMSARRIAEVTQSEALALPTLDENEVAEVLRNQPDTIEVLGGDIPVEYRNGYSPRVRLENEIISKNNWLNLPTEGIYLPSGQLVEVVVPIGYYAPIIDTNIPQLKEKVCEHLNWKQWDRWSNKPEIIIPDPTVNSSVPFITACYGKCVATGEELKAHGTLLWNSLYNRFSVKWFRSEEESGKARVEAQQKFSEMRKEAEQKHELESAEKAKEATKLSIWIHNSGSAGYGGGYVVKSDGSLREHDSVTHSARFNRGSEHYVWNNIEDDEVVVIWTDNGIWTNNREVYAELPITKIPESGFTAKQLEKIAELEHKHDIDPTAGWLTSIDKNKPIGATKTTAKNYEVDVDSDNPFAVLRNLKIRSK